MHTGRALAAYLKDQDPRVRDGEVDPHAFAVVGVVRPDAVHVQLPGHLQQLDVGLCGRHAPAETTLDHQSSISDCQYADSLVSHLCLL